MRKTDSGPENLREDNVSDQSLLELFDQVREKTLEVLDGVTESQAAWKPPGLRNSILWHAAHCCVVAESLIQRALDQDAELPQGWFDMFSWKACPSNIPPDRWPTLEDVVGELQSQRPRLRRVLAGLTEEQLTAAVPRKPQRSVRNLIIHALHDEACHAGEIWLLRKIQQADPS